MNGFKRLHGALALLAVGLTTLPGCIQFGFTQKEIDDAKIQFGIGGNTDGGTSGDDDDNVNIDGATGKVCDRDEDCGSGFKCESIGGGEKRCRTLNDDGVSLDDAGMTTGAGDSAGTDGATDSGSETTDGDDTTTPTDCAPPDCEALGRICGSVSSECGATVDCNRGGCGDGYQQCPAGEFPHSVLTYAPKCAADGMSCPTEQSGEAKCTFTCVGNSCATPGLESNVPVTSGSAPSARQFASLARGDGDQLRLIGGQLGDRSLTDEIWLYTGGIWTKSAAKLGAPLYRAAAATLPDDTIVVVGGAKADDPQTAGDYFAGVQLISGVTVTAVATGASHTARTGIALGVGGTAGKIYKFGGSNDQGYFNDLWSSSDGDTWTEITPTGTPPAPRADAHLFVYQDRIYVSGGADATTVFDDTWVYNPLNQAWTKLTLPGPPVPRHFNGRALFVRQWDRWVIAGARTALTTNGPADDEQLNAILVWSEDGWTRVELDLFLRGAAVEVLPDGSGNGDSDALIYFGGYESSAQTTNRMARVAY